MKHLFIIIISFVATATAFAQKETYDLLSYAKPKDSAGLVWKKEVREDRIYYSVVNNKTKAWCQIFIFRNVASKGDIEKDFASEWKDIVVQSYKPTSGPETEDVIDAGDWKIKMGRGRFKFNNEECLVALVSATGFNVCMSVTVTTNSQAYTGQVQKFLGSLDLRKPDLAKQSPAQNNTVQNNTTSNAPGKFQFSTTNWDDGWVSNVKNDWVEVSKGNMKVLIHYPNKEAEKENSQVKEGTVQAWNVLVAPRYSSGSNMLLRPVSGLNAVQFHEGDMVDKATGKSVYVVLFYQYGPTSTRVYLEFITPDKATFEREFVAWHNDDQGWEKMSKFAAYNRFAVGPSDLTGKWTSSFTGGTHYVNVYTGAYAGMDAYSSTQNYVFSGSSYNWELVTAQGMVGNMKFNGVKSAGKWNVVGNWQVYFSDIEKKPRTYGVCFTPLKGGVRILWIDGQAFGKAD